MSNKLASLAIELSANLTKFESDMGRAARIAKKESDKMKKQIGVAMKAIAASAVTAAAGLGTVVKMAANTADSMQKMSSRLGVTTNFLSEMRLAADLTDNTIDGLGKSITKMSKSVNDARNGLSTAKRAFSSLGISLDEIQKLNTEEQFLLIADRLSKVSDQSVKAGAAMDIFGRSGTQLLTMFENGADGIKDMRMEAQKFGLTISQDTANAAAEFNDELTRMGARFTGLRESIGQSLIPVFTEVLKQMNSEEISRGTDKVDALQSSIITLYGAVLFVGDAFETMGKLAAIAFATIENASKTALGGFDVARKRIVQGLSEFGGLFSENLAGFAEFVEQDAKDAEQVLAETLDNFVNFAKTTSSSIDGEIVGVFEESIQKIQDLRTVAGKTGKSIDGSLIKPAEKASKAWGGFNEVSEKTEKQLKSLVKDAFNKAKDAMNDFQSVVQQFETPMEQLNRTYAEQIATIENYKELNKGNAEVQIEVSEALERAKKSYEDQKQAIESQLTPLEELITSLDSELQLMGQSTDQLRRNDAVRLLMSSGVIKAGDDLKQYAKIIELVTGKLKQLEDQQSVFGGGINSFSDLLKDASKDFSQFFDTISDGFKNMSSDSQKFADGLGSVLDFGREILGYWDSTAGQDDAGRVLDTISQIASTGVLGPAAQAIAQVASFVNDLTGGKLFGTSYETQGVTSTLGVGSNGGFGQIDTLQTRERSLFRGTKSITLTDDLDSQTLDSLNSLFDQLNNVLKESAIAVGAELGTTLPALIEGTFVQEFDKDGNLVSSTSMVLGRMYEETFKDFSKRLTGENILAGLSEVFDEVGQIANRWRGDADMLLDGAQLLLQAGADITAGQGLFQSLTAVTTVITDMSRAGETLTETYQRVQGSVLLFDDALEIIGQSFDMARVDYVRLAADITDAAGGLEQAASLWQSYFDTFYTEQELFEQSLNAATINRDISLGNLGLDTNISVDAFREMFESVLPTLSADAVVEWLRAADAIGIVVDLEADLNAQREENAQQLAELIGQINSEIEDMNLTPFAASLKDIGKAFRENIKTARDLGASERELAMIQAYAVRQIQQAIQALEQDISGALTDLYGTELDQINQQIATLEQQQGAINSVQQASDNLYESQLRAIQNIAGFVDSLYLDEQLSPLNPQQQLDEALDQFNELLGQAQLGDVDALNALPGLAQTLLGFGRDVFASGDAYIDLFDFVTSSLSGLGVTATPNDPQQTIIGQNSQMIDLLARRNELEEQFDSQSRLDAALAIADQIAELVSVTGESFTSLADRLGIPVEEFLSDLGLSLDELTVETATALGETAALLGVEITDLAQSVGIALGNLADDQSLLNDALEQTIAGLPEGIANDLDALLTAIEKSTNPEAREDFLRQMVDYIDELPADQRDLLAPYFEQIDPITEAQQQVNIMQSVEATNQGIFEQIAGMRTESEADRERSIDEQELTNENIVNLTTTIQEWLDRTEVA
jgi:hypothetical protein